MNLFYVIIFSLFFLIGACKNDGSIEKNLVLSEISSDTILADKNEMPIETIDDEYLWDTPEVIIMEQKLSEISGLSFHPDNKTILTHNDEKGRIYEIDMDDGSILNNYKFGRSGDYESIELVGDEIVVAKNNGDLYFYDPNGEKTEIVKTSFSARNDVEGMGLLIDKNILLLACKGQPLAVGESRLDKAIYAFDLNSKTLNEDPYLIIKEGQLIARLESQFKQESKSKRKKMKNRAKDFSPSGIAVHPRSGDLYVLSARGSLLLIYDSRGKLKNIVVLNKKSNPQPEGICFDDSENLYISSEGKGFSGKIFKFIKK